MMSSAGIALGDAALQIPKKIAVAWSGGADSTALVLLLLEQGYEVQAWHVDHGWHQGSSEHAMELSKQAQAWNVQFQVRKLQKPLKNLEAEARKERYACFQAMAEAYDCFDLCLGHHADDQAETVYMRMLQGSGVAGCQGMRALRRHGQLNLWRPLLKNSRDEIEQYLHRRKVVWINDPSNEDISLWRNKIRHHIFPHMRAQGADPKQLFLRWQQVALTVQAKVELLGQDVTIAKQTVAGQDICKMDWTLWQLQLAPVRVYLLQQMIGLLFADGSVLGRRHILAIEQWRKHGGHGWLNLSGCCLYRKEQDLQLCKGKMSLRDNIAENAA